MRRVGIAFQQQLTEGPSRPVNVLETKHGVTRLRGRCDGRGHVVNTASEGRTVVDEAAHGLQEPLAVIHVAVCRGRHEGTIQGEGNLPTETGRRLRRRLLDSVECNGAKVICGRGIWIVAIVVIVAWAMAGLGIVAVSLATPATLAQQQQLSFC